MARQQNYTFPIPPLPGLLDLEASMTALAVVIARVLFKESFQTIDLKLMALFCGTGLLASLFLIAYGLVFGFDFF